VVKVRVPNKLSDEQRELFEKLAATMGAEQLNQKEGGFWSKIFGR
jgi:molecular chaperone DnaJ